MKKQGKLRKLCKSLLTIAGFYIGAMVLMYIFQYSVVYYPTYSVDEEPAEPFERVCFKSGDGVKLWGWFAEPQARNSRGVVLFCHGNAGKHTAGYLKSHEIYSKAIDAFLEDIYNEQ